MLTYRRPWTDEDARKHIRSQVESAQVEAVTGKTIDLPVGQHEVSLCCHSDSPGCVEILTAAREIIDEVNKKRFG